MDKNSIWYLGLGILSVLLLLYVCLYKKNVQSLLTFGVMVAIGYLIETVIYVFGGSYQYFPKLIPGDAYYDSNLGAIASNTLALPVAATFIAAFQLRLRWNLMFALLLTAIELLFLRLGIYSHNWWKAAYTVLGLPFYFLLAKLIYVRLLERVKGFTHSLVLLLIIQAILGTAYTIPIMFWTARYYQVGWFDNLSRDTTAFSSIYSIGSGLLLILLVKLQWKRKWIKYAIVIAATTIVTILLKEMGILHSMKVWDPYCYILMPAIALWFAGFISKRLSSGPRIH